MIVLSAGMQKSGTGWYWNMTNELMMAAGHPNAREVRETRQLQSVITAPNCNVPKLSNEAIMALDRVGQDGVTFVVKSHRRPSKLLRELIAKGNFKATYIYRDLRDIIVSALDRGKEMRETGDLHGRHFYIGPQKSFAKYRTVRGAILWARFRLLPVWKAWSQCDGALLTRYEDLHADTGGQLQRLAEYLELDVSEKQIETIVAKYDRSGLKGKSTTGTGMHFNKGITGRFKEVLNEEQQEMCRKRLGKYLDMMGYSE